MMDPILVTGANGLIGRAAIARLAASRRIYALVREKPEAPLAGAAESVVHDLREPFDCRVVPTPETIIHLAQSPCYRDFPDGALDVFEVNTGATQRLLDWASRSGVKRFIFASSGGVYGHGDAPSEEEAPLSSPADLGHYIASKRCGELLAGAYCGRMIVIILRFFFVYGPGQRRAMLIPRLVDSVLHGRPIQLQGPDGIRINPIYVDDTAEAIEVAAKLQTSETINIAGPEALTLREIGTLIGDHVSRPPQFEIHPGTEARYLVGSVEKMTRLLGAPRTRMTEGLKRMIITHQSAPVPFHTA